MPSGLLTEWMAFDEIEPISLGFHVDLAGANAARTTAEVYRDRKRRSEPYKMADFMPRFAVRKQTKSAKDIYGMFRDWAVVAGGEDPSTALRAGSGHEEGRGGDATCGVSTTVSTTE